MFVVMKGSRFEEVGAAVSVLAAEVVEILFLSGIEIYILEWYF